MLAAALPFVAAPAQPATPCAPRFTPDASIEELFLPITPTRLRGAQRHRAPVDGISAVTMTLTAVTPSTPTYLTAYPSRVKRPNASSINVTAGVIRANTVTLPGGPDGMVRIYHRAGSIDVLSDMTGLGSRPPPTPPS